jgi:hypothetical protein
VARRSLAAKQQLERLRERSQFGSGPKTSRSPSFKEQNMVAHTNRMNEQFREAMERPTEMVREYPLASMLLMFGVGLGVGVVVSSAICSSLTEEESHSITKSMSHVTDKVRHQVYDALSSVLSPSMLKQLQSYVS